MSRAARTDPLESLSYPAHEDAQEARYRALLDQIPAVVFMAGLDGGIGEAYK